MDDFEGAVPAGLVEEVDDLVCGETGLLREAGFIDLVVGRDEGPIEE